MKKDEISGSVGRSGYKGDEEHNLQHAPPGTPDAARPMDPVAGRPAEETNGAVRGSGQSTGHGNAGEEPDSDPQGGDGSSIGLMQARPPKN